MKASKLVGTLLLVMAALAISASPALANHIDTATATVSCTGYSLTVSASQLATSGVTYSISYTITPSSGSPITGSIPVTPDANGNFTTTVSNSATFSGAVSFTGTASLLANGAVANTIDIAFTPSTLTCGTPPPSPCPTGVSNSSILTNFGTAGPNNFTVLSLGGTGAVVNINLATVHGNVGVPNYGTLKESAPSVVTGDLIIGSAVNTTGVVGQHGPIVVDDSKLAAAVSDAFSASASFASLSPTPAVQAQFPANGQFSGNLTVTGDGSVDVVNLPAFMLNGNLTLTGPAGTGFVINISGQFNLHSGNIKVSGGVGPLDVVYNITNPNATVTTMVPTTAVGILLAPNNNINSMDSATFTGEVIGGYEKTIVLMSGSRVQNPCQ